MLNSNTNFIAKKNYINNNNIDANNSNSNTLKVKLLSILHKRKAFVTRFIQLKFLLKTHIKAFNKSITTKKDKC
jgi:hypothetical protein